MREAPALAGVTRARPRSGAASKAKTPPRKRTPSATLLGRAFARPGVTVAGAAFAALMTGIVANAMFLQKGHRPAPLFKQSQPVAPVAARQVPAPDPVAPPPAPAPPAAVAPAPASAEAPAPAPLPKPARPAAPTSTAATRPKAATKSHERTPAGHAAARRDAIGDLLGDLSHEGHKTRPVETPAASRPHAHAAKAAAPVAKQAAAPQQ